VGHVVLGGAADNDGHLCPGDEITYINGLCVIGASHRKVVQLMTDAAHTGHVTLRVRRKARPAHSAYLPELSFKLDTRPLSFKTTQPLGCQETMKNKSLTSLDNSQNTCFCSCGSEL